jgi:hypothetical protein
MIGMIPKTGNKNRINNKDNYRQNILHEYTGEKIITNVSKENSAMYKGNCTL